MGNDRDSRCLPTRYDDRHQTPKKTVPDFLHDDYAAEAFHRALLSLKCAIDEEGRDGVKVICDWIGRKKSTVYAWLSGSDATGDYQTPGDWEDIWRLAHASTQAGYTEFAEGMTAASMHLEGVAETQVNGTLTDEKRTSDKIWGRIYEAKDTGNGDAIVRLGSDLRSVADHVIAEGRAERS